jgi:hypothetical protein
MRTTLIIDEGLLERARELTGIREKTALVRAGLEALIAREAASGSLQDIAEQMGKSLV